MNKYKDILMTKKLHLINNIKDNLDPLLATVVSFVDKLDFAANESSKSVLSELKNKDILTLKKVEHALSKIENDDYGYCEECEEGIQPKRLEAQPWAIFCFGCQEQQDSHGKKHAPSRNSGFRDEEEEYFDKDESDKSGAI